VTPLLPVTPLPHKLDYSAQGNVLALDAGSFEHTIKQGDVFVKFFTPGCKFCKRIAPHWTQLARRMQHKLTIAEVDCQAKPAICQREGVANYPTLLFYSSGGSKTEYTGGRKLDQLVEFAESAHQLAMQELPEEELELKVKENEVMFLFLHTKEDSKRLVSIFLSYYLFNNS
jgi:thioredoxin domain-containing protein 5